MSSPFCRAPMMLRAALLATSALAPVMAQAQQADTVLDEIVLTAAGRAQSLENVQASIQVVTADDIAASGARNTFELLDAAVGVDAATSGTRTLIRMRGQNEYSTLLLIDGMPRPGNYGGMNFGNIPADDIEQIEIVRGPMSALYGADALGGVINVITKRPGANPGTSLSSTLGLHTGKDSRAALKFSLAHEFGDSTLGHRISLGASGSQAGKLAKTTTAAEDFPNEREYDLAYAGSWAPTDTDELNWRFELVRQNDESLALYRSAPFTSFERETRKSVDLSYKKSLGTGDLTLSAYYGDADGWTNYSYAGPGTPGIEATRHKQSRLQARYDAQMGAHHLSFAAGYQNDNVDLTQNTRKVSEDQYFALVQDEWAIHDNLVLTAGLRLDDHEAFGSSVSPRLSLGTIGDGLTWRVSAGEAYRAPTALERYARIPRLPSVIITGNPDLKAEESRSFEAAIGWRDATRSIELVAHDSKVENLITSVTQPGRMPFTALYSNTDRARMRGVELTGHWDVNANLSLGASVEYLDAKNRKDGARLTGRYKQAYNLNATWTEGAWSVTGSLDGWAGYYAADPAIRNSRAFESSFAKTNLAVSYQLSDQTSLHGGVNNVFNRATPINYNNGYATDNGRFAFMTVNHRF